MCDGTLRYTGRCQVQGWLDSLPPSTALTISLIVVGLFLALCLAACVSALRRSGRK